MRKGLKKIFKRIILVLVILSVISVLYYYQIYAPIKIEGVKVTIMSLSESDLDSIKYHYNNIYNGEFEAEYSTLLRLNGKFPEGDEKKNLIALICNHMKKDYMAWNKDTVDDRKIAEDLSELSGGKLQMDDDIVRLMAERLAQNYRPKTNYTNNRNNNQRRKY